MPLAYSYLRFSSAAQADGDSERRQNELRKAWIARNPTVTLSELSFEDKGVSGFTGKHREEKHALGRFIALVNRGEVPKGSYLIVENQDRLSREAPMDAMMLIGRLMEAGIRVVVLSPIERIYEPGMDQMNAVMMLLDSIRGYGESERKSGMSTAVQGEIVRKAREHKAPHGNGVPAWLKLGDDGKYRVREDAEKVVRTIFKWSAQGRGIMAIARQLNADGVPVIARGKTWNRSYVCRIVNNRAAFGEFQPMKGTARGKAVPDGEPIQGYFPAVVNEQEWDRAQAAARNRTKVSGRPCSPGFQNVFSGLLRSALDQCSLYVINRAGKRLLASSASIEGVAGAKKRPFPLEVFQKAVLSQLKEVAASDLFQEPNGGRVAELEERMGQIEKRLKVAVEHFDADPESPTWADRVTKYDKEKRALERELADARREAANPLTETWTEAVSLMAEEEPGRLRQALLATVESVQCVVVLLPKGRRVCGCQVFFKRSEQRRSYLIHYLEPKNGGRAAAWSVRSLPDARQIDLRERGDAEALEAELMNMELPNLTRS